MIPRFAPSFGSTKAAGHKDAPDQAVTHLAPDKTLNENTKRSSIITEVEEGMAED